MLDDMFKETEKLNAVRETLVKQMETTHNTTSNTVSHHKTPITAARGVLRLKNIDMSMVKNEKPLCSNKAKYDPS